MIGDMTVISMTPEDELIMYIEKLCTNAVAISGNNHEKHNICIGQGRNGRYLNKKSI